MSLTNVMEIPMSEYAKFLDFVIKTGGNLLVLGMAGVGKTEMAMAAIRKLGYNLVLVNVSTIEFTDLVGLPTISVDEDGYKYAEYCAPKFMVRPPTPLTLENLQKAGLIHKKTVFLFDEIDKGKPEIQNPALELFQFHSLNGTPVDAQAFIATGNLPDENAFSRPISHALTNRCMVFKVKEDFEAWCEHSIATGLNTLVLAFLSKHVDNFSEPIPDDRTAYTRGSPRAWTLAGADLDHADAQGLRDLDFQTMIVAGRVGNAAALEFRTWLEHYRTIENYIDPLLNEGKKPKTLESLQHTFILGMMAAGQLVRQMAKYSAEHKDKKAFKDNYDLVQKMTRNLFTWLESLNSPDVGVAIVKTSFSADMKAVGDYKLVDINEFMKVFMAIRKITN